MKTDVTDDILFGYNELRKESDTMEGKVLLFIRDYQLKIKVIHAMTDMHVSFMEVFEKEELSFKMQLIQNENRLYIHEYMFDDDEQFDKIRSMKENGWKVLIIFPKYEIEYIDKSQEAKADDLMVQPIEVPSFKSKLTTLMNLPVLKVVASNEEVDGFRDLVEMEVNRAQRGSYALSFVMVDMSVLKAEEKLFFVDQLKSILRETDMVVKTHERDYYMIVCPFTPKEFLVEVENKIRRQFSQDQLRELISTKGKLYLYGLTLGQDGDNFEVIYEKLMNSIANSKILDQAISKNVTYNKNKLNAYKTILRKFQ